MKDLSQMEELTSGFASIRSKNNEAKSKNSSMSFDSYEFLMGMGMMAMTYNWTL